MPNFGSPQNPAPGSASDDLVRDSTDRTFVADVIEASRTVPVIVDFWATWCGPCKQLGPVIEKAVRAAKGKVKLVKIDTDKNQMIASQLRVQSIPAVYAFFKGRPVDGFVGALPEAQIKQFIDRLIALDGGAGGADDGGIEAALEEAKRLADAGNYASAADLYSQILSVESENAAAYAGLARALIAVGQFDDAQHMLDSPPAALAKDKALAAAKVTLEVVREAGAVPPVGALMEKLAHDANDHAVRFDLAMALFRESRREAAVEQLLEIVKRDREWNDEAARKRLVKFFEVFGPTDPLTLSSRRKLSSILFS